MNKKPYFYDPGFAFGTAILSLLTAPIWMLMAPTLESGACGALVFAFVVLIVMLYQSHAIARDE